MLQMIARQEKLTIPSAITKVVSEAIWQRAFAAEREAQRLDNLNPAAHTEDAEWEAISDEAIQ
ncbi:MAG: hypothetical protein LBK28_08490 [Propionibacteriaceae bacterium]|jgi:hypothetical protein|nr:hypothetical protein [Propionibacteriaceae bacterium]